MQVISRETIIELIALKKFEIEDIKTSLLIHSYDEYKSKGGIRSQFDLYAKIKEAAKEHEGNYISLMDQMLSGIPIPNGDMRANIIRFTAQAYWLLLHELFGAPIRYVSYNNFDLNEFNKL